MKKILKLTVFTVVLLMLAGGLTTCKSNEKPLKLTCLEDTEWKLTAFVDTQTGTLTEPEPKSCNECYTLKFETNTLCGVTSSNRFCGDYKIDYEVHSIRISNIAGDEKGEQGYGSQYYRDLLAVQSFSYNKNELKLFYNDKKNYLLFKSN